MILRGSVYSKVLDLDTGLTILTPKDYDSNEKYPVAYLLHGLTGNHDSWLTNTMLPVYANKYQMIFVMPEVNRSFYTNMRYGLNYFDYISLELPKIIKQTFNISSRKEDTYIMGASMGGYGALKCGLNYPETFGNVLAFSSAMLLVKQELPELRRVESQSREDLNPAILKDLESAFGPELAIDESVDLLTLATKIPERERPNVFVSCGTADNLLANNRIFNEEISRLGWQITYCELPGNHDWYHFNEALVAGLRWTRKNKG